ncbi:VWA domain-containing protein [Kordiimonas sp. SCSIO 12610]|uniref:VWA domain-containing protein n=1 Tax=Kordiimonas sp. SCSIO 12610 TaxID=2829597 RepID=UPI00210F22D8|nr:VWA domain-containing protein [Kordiimonas sp. SCSIO 12610]UTW55665.1 VWA domain-containing protein [Kordiimonas sp. SCSIO 12610]
MAAKRKTESSTLAFLDIISCGLGAVILIFLIIKHNVDIGSEQTDDLKSQLAALEEEAQKLSDETEKLRRQNADTEQAGKSLEDQLVESDGKLAALRQQNTSQEKQNKLTEGELEKIEVEAPVDQVELKGAGQANYIVGMKVEGERIAIILDHSTSMTHPTLERAVLAKFDSPTQRQRAPKWQRTVRVAKWLLARVPVQSQYAVIGFNNSAGLLSPQKTWLPASNTADLAVTIRNIAALSPSGGTNLEEGIKAALNMSPAPTSIYIVTDGLPTNGSVSCAKKASVTPACRRSLMGAASKLLASSFPRGNVPINTILLPMTGDPDAPSLFWAWANSSKGIVLSPSKAWP